ncbi:hypothetical protein HORIV_42130 [Vreelandella olivaria]|uniref:Protoporphyrinogen IX oxidase n=1 Tax=Vreelandella olivaria TaxID=390919 RepID=A0ABM7GIS2_9GAMM|nr:hypothetical protein HORIV_42130 [Halomonas olivaria]
MPWLKLLHIAALVIWCGSLLYLPALLSQALQLRKDAGFAQGTPPMPRFFYNSIATPAALIAIASGTLLFLIHGLLGVADLKTGCRGRHGGCARLFWLVNTAP